MPTDLKQCSHCNEFKQRNTEYFYRDRSKKDGLRHLCKVCDLATIKTRRKKSFKRRSITEGQFWGQVNKTDECWIWRGKVGQGKYGLVVFNDKWTTAHRVAWILTFGDIPNGLLVCHHCDNPPCVNPAHLFLGTNKDNAMDKVRKGRAYRGRGEANTRAKLKYSDVLNIRLEYTAKKGTLAALGRKYGVSTSTIDDIVKGRTWKEL